MEQWRRDRFSQITIRSPLPAAVQGYYSHNPRSNTTTIRRILDRILYAAGVQDIPLLRLPETGNVLVPSTEADDAHPQYWVIRLSGLLSRNAQDGILTELRHTQVIGCRPFVSAIERTDGGAAHHPGIFLKPSQIKTPWVTNDTLQPSSPIKILESQSSGGGQCSSFVQP